MILLSQYFCKMLYQMKVQGNKMNQETYICPKCNNSKYESGQFQSTGGTFSKLFNVQNQKFTTVSCTQCTYTEIYKGDTNTVTNVLDFFTN